MADLAELGQAVKAKYPGSYDHISDYDLAAKVKEKYPGSYPQYSVPGMEKLGGVPPKAGAMPVPEGLKPEQEPTGFGAAMKDFITSPKGLIRTGLNRAVEGVESGSQPGINPKLHAAHEVIGGLATAASPIGIGAAIANPIPAITAGVSGLGAQQVARHAAPLVGASPEASELAGDVAGIGGGIMGTRIPGMLPSAARAGANLQAVSEGPTGGVHIDVSKPGATALEILKDYESGGARPKVINDFLKRTTDPSQPPLTFKEGRLFESNAGRMSTSEQMKSKPNTARLLGEFSRGLREAMTDAAEQGGQKEQYLGGLGEYRNAMRIRGLGETAKDVGKDALKLGIGGGVAGLIAREALKK